MRARSILPVLTIAITAATAVPAKSASDGVAAVRGARWLVARAPVAGDGAAADALVAMRAAGVLRRTDARRRAAALRRGAPGYAIRPGAAAKVALGLIASGQGNPRCAGRIDLIGRIRARGGRLGTVMDQTLAIMALHALHAKIPASVTGLLAGSRGRGGWNLSMSRSGPDSVTSTALAILALRQAGVPAGDRNLRAGYAWLLSRRFASGGYGEDGGGASQANATALAIRAGLALGRRDTRAIRALRSLQPRDGSFVFTRTDGGSRLLATNDAVLALLGRTAPVSRLHRVPRGC